MNSRIISVAAPVDWQTVGGLKLLRNGWWHGADLRNVIAGCVVGYSKIRARRRVNLNRYEFTCPRALDAGAGGAVANRHLAESPRPKRAKAAVYHDPARGRIVNSTWWRTSSRGRFIAEICRSLGRDCRVRSRPARFIPKRFVLLSHAGCHWCGRSFVLNTPWHCAQAGGSEKILNQRLKGGSRPGG